MAVRRRGLPAPAVRRDIRRGCGATLAAVAAEIGVTINTVSRWERDDRGPSDEHLDAYLLVLGRMLDTIKGQDEGWEAGPR